MNREEILMIRKQRVNDFLSKAQEKKESEFLKSLNVLELQFLKYDLGLMEINEKSIISLNSKDKKNYKRTINKENNARKRK